jgi:hypothetical protein
MNALAQERAGKLQATSGVRKLSFKLRLSKVTVLLDGAFDNTEAVRLRNVRFKRLDSKAAVVFKRLRFKRPHVHDERYSRTDAERVSFRQRSVARSE